MDLGLKDKIAFVAASSQGLGKSVATELAAEGANVIICARNREHLEQAKREIEKASKRDVLALAGDLSDAVERVEIINKALQHYHTIDILVTNTGDLLQESLRILNRKTGMLHTRLCSPVLSVW